MKLNVVMLCYDQQDVTRDILESIRRNTVKPSRFVIVDNGSSDNTPALIESYMADLPMIEHIGLKRNIGIVRAGRISYSMVEPDADIICSLGNDLVLPSFLFKNLIEAFTADPSAGAIVPFMVGTADKAWNAQERPLELAEINRREGWCMTLRKEILDDCLHLFEGFYHFCTDDLVFTWCKKLGFKWKRMLNVPVYHHTSRTLSRTNGFSCLEQDGALWQRIIAQEGLEPFLPKYDWD